MLTCYSILLTVPVNDEVIESWIENEKTVLVTGGFQ